MRCYLMIPNVIVLFAADVEFVRRMVYHRFAKSINERSGPNLNDVDRYFALQLTEQYMLKYFPPRRQIHLFSLEEYLQTRKDSVLVELFDENDKEVVLSSDPKDKQIETQLLHNIFRKTGLYFISAEGYHRILPTTQRGLANLISLLLKMENVKHLEDIDDVNINHRSIGAGQYFYYASDEDGRSDEYVVQLRAWLRNVDKFYDYFMNEWVMANLNSENQRKMQFLAQVRLAEKNDYVLSMICKTAKYDEDSGKESIKISYAEMIDALEDYQKKNMQEPFEYAIRIYYALLTQKIVLAEMIKYYSADESVQRENCAFKNLYALYGSELISIKDNRVRAKDAGIIVEFLLTYENNTVVDYLAVKPDSDEEGKKSSSDEETEKQLVERQIKAQIARKASNMMTEFEKSPNNKTVKLSMLSSIVNSLYMRSRKDIAPLFNYADEVKEDNIQEKKMQDACIRFIVNVDCQESFLKWLGTMKSPKESEGKYFGPNRNISAFLGDLYKGIWKTFGMGDNGEQASRLTSWLAFDLPSNKTNSLMEMEEKAQTYLYKGFVPTSEKKEKKEGQME